MEQWCDPAKEAFANGVQEDALNGKEGCCCKDSAHRDGDKVGEEMAYEIVLLRGEGKKKRAEDTGTELHEGKEDS